MCFFIVKSAILFICHVIYTFASLLSKKSPIFFENGKIGFHPDSGWRIKTWRWFVVEFFIFIIYLFNFTYQSHTRSLPRYCHHIYSNLSIGSHSSQNRLESIYYAFIHICINFILTSLKSQFIKYTVQTLRNTSRTVCNIV